MSTSGVDSISLVGRARGWVAVCLLLGSTLPAFAQGYTYSPMNADEQPGNVYFGTAKDADGKFLAGVTVVLATANADFVLVTYESGRFRMLLPVKVRPSDVRASCSRRGYVLEQAMKRPPRGRALTPVEINCRLRREPQ